MLISSPTIVARSLTDAPRRPARVSRRVRPVYVRRRLGVVLGALIVVLIGATALAVPVGAHAVLANRGGAPASTPAVRPATSGYVVRSGDTLWSVAVTHRGALSQRTYVERLIDLNGGTALAVGQLLRLP